MSPVVFPSSTKREIRHFYVVVVQRQQRNVQKSVMHVQSCCFANLNLLRYCRSLRRRRRRCLSSLLTNPLVTSLRQKSELRLIFSNLADLQNDTCLMDLWWSFCQLNNAKIA